MDPTIITGLASLGAAGAVIIALYYHQKNETEREKSRNENDQKVLDRIDRIVDRHMASEESNRQQIAAMVKDTHGLFDRVINVCTDLSVTVKDLSNTVKDLSSSTRANEKAIIDLRHEFRSIGGLQSHRALGHEDPRPFPSG